MTRVILLITLGVGLAACPSDGDGDGDSTSGDGDGDGDEIGHGDVIADDVDGGVRVDVSIMERFVGLWHGPAESSTSLGDFPLMMMDARPISDRALFARGDLDGDNAIRFRFNVEFEDGEPVLIFHNGGLFEGLSRDSRAKLETVDAAAGTYRFCAVSGGFCDPNPGCDYVDAIWQFDGDDALSLDVLVCGEHHVTWDATRIETRDAPAPFPLDDTPQTAADIPALPGVDVTMSWDAPAHGGEQLFISLSDSPCSTNPFETCATTRAFLNVLEPGQTEASFRLEQVHPGSYFVNGLLDNDGNGFPSDGDFISAFNATFTLGDDDGALALECDVPIAF